MDKLKQYVAFTVLGCLLVLAAGWFLLVSPKRSEAAELRAQAGDQVAANAKLQTKLEVLKAQAKDLPKQQAKLAAVAAKIPDNPALPSLVRALTGAATAAGVELVSVSPAQPVPVVTAAAPAAASAAGAARTGTASVGSVAGSLTQIPVTLNVVGGYFQVQQFVANLENLPRSLRVSGLTLTPGANPVKPAAGVPLDTGKSLTTTITGQVYMAANRPPATPVTVPGSQAVAGTATGPVVPVAPAKK